MKMSLKVQFRCLIIKIGEIARMSIYVLIDYIEFSRKIRDNPTWEGLKRHKKMFWRDQDMNTTQMSLELSVATLGISNNITLMVSKERDKEIAIAQRKIFNEWKETNCNNGNNC